MGVFLAFLPMDNLCQSILSSFFRSPWFSVPSQWPETQFLVRSEPCRVAGWPSCSQIRLSLYSTTSLPGHSVRSYCKFVSNLTLSSPSASLLSRILPPFECLCFKLQFPGCTVLHFPMNVTVIFQLYIFNHSTSTFTTSVFVDASSSFRCMK